MSIYGPNFTIESTSIYPKPKTITSSGRIRRQDMGRITPLINLSNELSFKMFWIGGGHYQPFYEFDQDSADREVVGDCQIFAKRTNDKIEKFYSITSDVKKSTTLS